MENGISASRPKVLYDGQCAFCKIWIEYARALAGANVDFEPTSETKPKSVRLIEGEQVTQGAEACFRVLATAPGYGLWLWMYQRVPGVAYVTERTYEWIALHRNFAYWLTILLFGKRVFPACHAFTEWVFARILGCLYLIAFLSLATQIRGLVGTNGMLPVHTFLDAVQLNYGWRAYSLVPTVFWFNDSDWMLSFVSWTGVLVALCLILGRWQRICLFILFVLYLSVCSAGQDFLSFQWDILLLETGFLGIFLGSSRLVVFLYRLLIFRLMFLSGAVKLLSNDPTWRDLSALTFHYWTQPLPTPIAWYLSQAPPWFQRFSTASVFVIELGAALCIFFPRRVRFAACGALAFLQVLILLSGNYGFFNLLSLALLLFLLDDRFLGNCNPPGRQLLCLPRRVLWPVSAFLGLIGLLQLSSSVFTDLPLPGRALVQLVAPYGIVNSYGLFASMTTTRPEIIVQGSDDGQTWQDYNFPYKVGDVKRSPPWVAPYMPRLDWQMWFSALSNWRSNPWFGNFMVRLLEGSPDVLRLLDHPPFPNHPPQFVRAELYQYRFTSWAERRATGAWWERKFVGEYFPILSRDRISRSDEIAPRGVQFVNFELPAESPSRDSQQLRSTLLMPIGLSQHLQNHVPLHAFEIRTGRGLHHRQTRGELWPRWLDFPSKILRAEVIGSR